MKSRSAWLAMRSPLISQLPRRSSASQPYTAGTFGHLAIAWATTASIGLESSTRRNDGRNRDLLVASLARALRAGHAGRRRGAAQDSRAGIRRSDGTRPRARGGGVLRARQHLP